MTIRMRRFELSSMARAQLQAPTDSTTSSWKGRLCLRARSRNLRVCCCWRADWAVFTKSNDEEKKPQKVTKALLCFMCFLWLNYLLIPITDEYERRPVKRRAVSLAGDHVQLRASQRARGGGAFACA